MAVRRPDRLGVAVARLVWAVGEARIDAPDSQPDIPLVSVARERRAAAGRERNTDRGAELHFGKRVADIGGRRCIERETPVAMPSHRFYCAVIVSAPAANRAVLPYLQPRRCHRP